MNIKQFFRGFSKGMSSMTLFPDIPRREDSPVSAWLAVGEAFRHTGDSIRKALHEQAARKEAK